MIFLTNHNKIIETYIQIIQDLDQKKDLLDHQEKNVLLCQVKHRLHLILILRQQVLFLSKIQRFTSKPQYQPDPLLWLAQQRI